MPAATFGKTSPEQQTREQRTIELLKAASQCPPPDAKDRRNEAVELNMPLAKALATRYAGRGIPLDDLTQVAFLGLVQAVERFDPTRECRFTDFAVPTIRGELRRHFRDAGWTVRPPRRLQELQARIWAVEGELTQQLHRSPKPRELAEHLQVDIEDVVEALALDGCFAPSSLDTPRTAEGQPAIDTLADDIDGTVATEARMLLAPAIRGLKPRDRQILELRFIEELTQQQIGDILGVTQMQVSRLVTRILRDLREEIDQPD